MKIKKIICFILTICISWLASAMSANLQDISVGMIIDGTLENQSEVLDLVKHEVLELTSGEFDVAFPADKTIIGEWNAGKVRQGLQSLLADRDVDIIITLGIMASNEACHHGPLPKPVIAPFVLDSRFQDLPLKNGVSGVKNLNYISVPKAFDRDIRAFREIVSFEKLAILVNEYWLQEFSDLSEQGQELFEEMDLQLQIVGVGDDVASALNDIESDVEAVYMLPLPSISTTDFKKIVEIMIERKLPMFSYVGVEEVEAGALAGLNKDILSKFSRRIALNIQRILLGESPESIPVSISVKHQLTINLNTAKALDIDPSWAVMTEADVVRADKSKTERTLDLNSAVKEALKVNLEVVVRTYSVAVGEQDVRSAWSALLPAIDLSGNYVMIDGDRAKASLGQQAERTLTGSVTASQLLFSEPAWANVSIQKKLQKSREYDLHQLKLDITEQTATAYLNVLRTKTNEKIQHNNLKVTRHNLELAQLRELVGSAGPAEVYRWESEVALNRKSVIEANSQRNMAEIQLNRLMRRPAEESFSTTDTDLNAPYLITSYSRLLTFIESQNAFKIFRNFMVEEAIQNSPELASLDQAIGVQQRLLASATNRFWAPTVALQGQYDNIFSREGKGTDTSLELPPELPFEFDFPQPKDRNWSVGLNISLPLFSGGDKIFQRQKASQKLTQLELERESVLDKLEQRMRSALHKAGASYASIKQTKLAAGAADKSLSVVQDAYSQGMVSLVELLDAQNAALRANEFAANSVYDFLIDLMAVERALGRFDFFSTIDRRAAFLQRAEDYFEKNGVIIQ